MAKSGVIYRIRYVKQGQIYPATCEWNLLASGYDKQFANWKMTIFYR